MRTRLMRGKSSLLFVVCALLLAVPAVAYAADGLIADGDTVTAGDQASRDLGTVGPGDTVTPDPNIDFYLDCNGQNHFNSGEQATIAFNSAGSSIKDADDNPVTTSGSLSATSLTNISGPTSWPDDGTGCGSGSSAVANALLGSSAATIVAPDDPGIYTYTVAYTVTRGTGTASNELDTVVTNLPVTFTLTVEDPNQPPTANAGGPYSVAEGGSVQLSGSGTDTDGTIASYAWDLNNDGTFETSGQNPTFSAASIDGPASRTVALKVTDNNGAQSSASTATVTINNANPAISSVTNNGPINEGQSATITVNATDPAGANDPLSYSFDCDNNGTYEVGPQSGNTHQCSFNDNGTPTVGVRVSDGDGGSATGSTQVTVNNLDPTIGSVTNNGPINEGGSATISVNNASDPAGANDPLSYSFDCNGDGDYTDAGDKGPQAASSASCSFADDGTYTVNVRVTDGDGGEATGSTQVIVNNVTPTINTLTASSANVIAGTANKVIFTANATAGPSDTITYTWSGGDAGAFTGNPYKTNFLSCGEKTVTVTATDDDNSQAQMTKTVNAWNAIFQAPIKDGTVNTSAKGQVVPVKASIGCGTTNLTTLQPVIQLLNGDATPEADSGTTAITTSVGSLADSGQYMRPVDAGYIYNLLTPSAAAGTKYTIRVNPWGAPPTGSTQQQIADWNLATGMYALLQIRK